MRLRHLPNKRPSAISALPSATESKLAPRALNQIITVCMFSIFINRLVKIPTRITKPLVICYQTSFFLGAKVGGSEGSRNIGVA